MNAIYLLLLWKWQQKPNVWINAWNSAIYGSGYQCFLFCLIRNWDVYIFFFSYWHTNFVIKINCYFHKDVLPFSVVHHAKRVSAKRTVDFNRMPYFDVVSIECNIYFYLTVDYFNRTVITFEIGKELVDHWTYSSNRTFAIDLGCSIEIKIYFSLILSSLCVGLFWTLTSVICLVCTIILMRAHTAPHPCSCSLRAANKNKSMV